MPSSSATTTSTFPFTFFSEDFPALNLNRSGESSSLNYAVSESEFKLPKTEPFYYPSDGFLETQPFNFLSIPIPNSTSSSSPPFHHLPDLHSLELTRAQPVQVQLYPPLLPELPSKRVRVDSATRSQETLDSIVQSCRVMPQSKLARRRRQKLSEKTQSLQRLMPWDTKMDMATMMDEAHKYITFLQAQLKALQTMPPSSSSSSSSANYEFGGLERLTRNQVLRVLLNSRVAQTVLYSKARCVVSVEQLDLLQKLIFQQRQQQQQLVLPPSSSRLFFNH
nr:transcription factor bHLH117 [Quercus suber]